MSDSMRHVNPEFKRVLMMEYNVGELFDNDSPNWKYCVEHASFAHKDEDACEFMLYLEPDDETVFEMKFQEMNKAGCSAQFMNVVNEARKTGAVWLLLYA